MARPAAYACYRCGTVFPLSIRIDSRGCPSCACVAPSNFYVAYDVEPSLASSASEHSIPSLWRYAERLPFKREHAVSLGEGLTPLLPTRFLETEIDVQSLLLKSEGCNPTWSHKDRFSTVAVTAAKAQGASVLVTSSTGNAGASLAAYAARAGLRCVVATLAGSAGPMLTQIQKYGARIVPFAKKSDRWTFLAEAVERFGWFATSPYRHPVVGSHPIGIEGYKTLAFEIAEQMGGATPDWCALPVCYGDALAGLWLGFSELRAAGEIERIPRLLAAEVHGSLGHALAQGTDVVPDMPPGVDTLAISVGASRSTFQALKALRASNGAAITVTNDGLIAAQEEIAAKEGIFLELSSTMSILAVAKARRRKIISREDTVVAIVTASGLKDVDRSACAESVSPYHDVDTALKAIEPRIPA